MQVIIESVAEVSDGKISGRALIPCVSRNGNLYTPDQLAEAKGYGTPLRLDWEHNTDDVIGHVTFSWDSSLQEVHYQGVITDQKRKEQTKNGTFQVSIEANVAEVTPTCTPKVCYPTLIGIEFTGMAITANPGVTASTLVVESKQDWQGYQKCSNCSDKHTHTQKESMTEQTPKEDVKENVATSDQVEAETSKVDTKTENAEAPKVAQKSETVDDYNGPNRDEIHAKEKEQEFILENLKQIINNSTQIKDLEKQAAESAHKRLYQVARISPESNKFVKEDLKYLANEMRESLRKFGHYGYSIDLSPKIVESISRPYNWGTVHEAISFSGDQSQKVAADRSITVLPGGKYAKSIRNLVLYDEIAEGDDLIKRFKGNIPDNGALTEGTDNTPATHTATTVTLAADTVTGFVQEIKKSDIEDSPFAVIQYITETARIETLESEATLVFDTAAQAATPGRHINGATGATLASGDDTTTGTFDPKGISAGLQYLEEQGYNFGFGEVFCAMHPRQLRELREDADLVRWVQQGDANITRTGQLTHLYGVELIPTTAVANQTAQTNTQYRAFMGIKGLTGWLASKRDLEIDLDARGRRLSVDWAWSQRKNATIFDPASYVRISSSSA